MQSIVARKSDDNWTLTREIIALGEEIALSENVDEFTATRLASEKLASLMDYARAWDEQPAGLPPTKCPRCGGITEVEGCNCQRCVVEMDCLGRELERVRAMGTDILK
jgi:hypothetical protein